MKIAFLHYHLNTGGVTTVVKQQVKALSRSCEVMLLTGEKPHSTGGIETRTIPGIGYDRAGETGGDHRKTADAVIAAIFDHWPAGCDILHVHNPTLAKNKNFLKILKSLQERGIRLFLQIHDFAEDGRPNAYFHHETYPENCHYGVINSRDYDILMTCGLDPNGLHRIFNTITPLTWKHEPERADYVLYPVRAIRRKNIGEALLLSLFLPRGESIRITLPPGSPSDVNSYDQWKRFVNTHRLPVGFEAGGPHNFNDLVGKARFLITTSITEGFGFCFLEPWTAGKLLWGRRLPEICRDFENAGINLDHLYPGIGIPLAWVDPGAFARRWQTVYREACRKFDGDPCDEEIKKALGAVISDGRIDFGLLDEPFQQQVLSRIIKSRRARLALIRLNPFLAAPGVVKNADDLIRQNRRAVLTAYTPSGYAENLLDVYRKIIEKPVRHQIDRGRLLRCFLKPERFSLLKWSVYDG